MNSEVLRLWLNKEMITTISDFFGIKTPKTKVANLSFQDGGTDPEHLFGIEIELEQSNRLAKIPGYPWINKTDGSLRNRGMEFVSVPLPQKYLLKELDIFYKEFLGNADFSPRTSIHVHMDATSFTNEQLTYLAELYLLFEKALFNLVGNGRDRSLFCVPLVNGSYHAFACPLNFDDPINLKRLGEWPKYFALNFCRIVDIGTVEFRHLNGTYVVERVQQWLNILGLLSSEVKKPKVARLSFLDLNSNSAYLEVAKTILGDYYQVFPERILISSMEAGCSHIKFQRIGEYEKKIAKELLPKKSETNKPENDLELERAISDIGAFLVPRPQLRRGEAPATGLENARQEMLQVRWGRAGGLPDPLRAYDELDEENARPMFQLEDEEA